VAYAVNQPRYLAGQHGQAVQLEEGTTNLLQTAQAPAQETLALTPGTVYTLSSAGTGQDVVIDHIKTDDLTTGTKNGTYNEGTDLKLTLEPAFSDTDTSQADFNGTHSNTVATAEGNVELTKTASGTNYNKVETTQADFQTGTLTDVVATAGGELELGTTTSNNTNTIIKKATFETAPFTVGGFYAWNSFTQSSAQKYTGTYSYTTNVSGATCVFTIPVGATTPLYWYNYLQSSGQCKFYLNNSLIRTTNADPGYFYSTNAASLVAGTTYTARWDSGDGGVFRQYIDDFEVRWNETVTTYPYKATGNRISPSYDISSVGEVASSTVSWTQVLPSASTTVVVEVSVDGGTNYVVATNGGTIPGLTPGTLTSGKNLRWKITLSSSDTTQTPKVSDITFAIVAKELYNTTGTYTSPVLNLTPCTVMTSNINWTDVIPAGAGVTVQTNYSANGTTWEGWVTASKNGAISGLSNGIVVATGAKLQYRATLTPTANQLSAAHLQDVSLTIDKANSGTRTSPAFSLSDVESHYSSNISWTATVPVGASLTVETSINGGSSWQAATNGGAISGLSGSLSGVSLLTRATLQTVTAPNPPTLHSLTVKVAACKTGSQFTITSATNQAILTPSGVTKWQLEQRAYKTTFTVGTREPESLTLNMGGGLNSDQGTFEVRAYEDGTTSRYAAIWDSYGTDMGSRFLLEKLTDSTYELYFNNLLAIKTSAIASVGSHVFAARWNGQSVWLLIDGVQVGTATLAAPVDMSKNEFIYLGSRYNNTRQWNGIIDEVRSSLVARTTLELLADAAGGPLPLDENTSCKLDFNGNMGVGAIEYPSLTYDGTARTYPLFTLLVKACHLKGDVNTSIPFQRRQNRNGSAVHRAVQRDLLYAEKYLENPKFLVMRTKAGLPAWEKNIRRVKQFEHQGVRFQIYGMMDGVLRYTPDNTRLGFEFKTKSTTISAVGNYMLKAPASYHLQQVTGYSLLFDLMEHLIVYESVAKDNWRAGEGAKPDIRAFLVEITERQRDALLDKYAEVAEARANGEVPKAETDNCLFCTYKSQCDQWDVA